MVPGTLSESFLRCFAKAVAANGWEIRIQSYDEIRVDTNSGYVQRTRRSLDRDEFNHLVMVVAPKLGKTLVYVNGRRLSTANVERPEALQPFIETSGEPLLLSHSIRPWGNSNFDGLID
ncbi:MAG: LamG-like jellyroll fold domain-containing protein [Verrucomicrobiales bacterium]